MGCVGSQADLPRTTIYSSKSPIIFNLSDKNKQKLIALIEKDDILNLAVAMSEVGAEPNSQISDPKMKWMLIHLCCRWDADNSLQYLLKHYFCEHPLQYIDFINAPTVEGYTCLHLCALWKSEKCFYVLHHYGGLNLNAKDKMMKTPYETAIQYKCMKMKDILQTYRDLNINFTQIETGKLISGDVIAEDLGTEMKKKQKSAEEQKKKLIKQNDNSSNLLNNLSNMQKELLEQRTKLQKQKEAILQSKMKQQLDADAQKAKIAANQTKNKIQESQKLQQQKQMKNTIDQQLKKQQQVLLSQLKAKDEELNKVKESLKKQQQERIKKEKEDAQRKAEEFIQQKQQQINNRIKQKQEALDKLKKQQEQKAQKQKIDTEQRMKKIQEEYAKKQQEMNKKLKQKQEQMAKLKQQQEERIKKEKQSSEKMTQEAAKKAQDDYNQKMKEKEDEMKKIKEQEAEKLKKQKEQAQKKALQLGREQTAKLNQQFNEAKRKQEQVKNKANQVIKTANNTAKQLKDAYNKINQQVPAEIDQLYAQALSSGSFFDKQFPAENKSIGDPSKANFANFTTNTVWLRPRQIFKSDFQLFDGIDPNDIKQGSLGVCYMLATISVLAENPKNIQKIFVFGDTRVGFYVLKFFINGKPKFITVDDQIPCNKTTKSPLFTKPIGKQIWVLLLEKAWAKVIGDYLSAQAMTPDHMMEDLSSAPGFGSWFEKDATKSNGEHIKTIIDNDKLGHVVVITSGDKKIEGIANNHAYSVLGVYEINKRVIFKVRNPWGQFEWNGQYGDNSSLWTPQIKKAVGYQAKDDGVFFISENQLTQAFCYYSISLLQQKSVYSWTEFTSKKFQDLFYKFKVTKPGSVNLRITQVFERMLRDKSYKYSPMVFEIGKINSENNVKFISQGSQKSYFGAKSVHAFESITQNLEAGQYFIRIRMLWQIPEKYSTAVLASYGPEAIKFEKLSQEQGTKYMKALFISFSTSTARNATGDAFYKIVTMKGQFLFIAQTDKDGKYKATFKFTKSKMQMAELDLSKVSDSDIELTLTKTEPGVGTAMRTEPSKGGTTGPVSILASKI